MTLGKRFLHPHQDIEDEVFAELDLREDVLHDQAFEGCVFEACDLSDASLSDTRFVDCRFVNCNLSNVRLGGTALVGVAFESCKLIGVDFSSVLRMTFDVSFNDSDLSWCVFADRPWRKAKIRNSRLRECEFEACDLADADLSGSAFPGCRFTRCTLHRADFRFAADYTLDPRDNHVKGARFAMPEVVGLLAGFGINIQ